MDMPGFTAEASLYKTKMYYRMKGNSDQANNHIQLAEFLDMRFGAPFFFFGCPESAEKCVERHCSFLVGSDRARCILTCTEVQPVCEPCTCTCSPNCTRTCTQRCCRHRVFTSPLAIYNLCCSRSCFPFAEEVVEGVMT